MKNTKNLLISIVTTVVSTVLISATVKAAPFENEKFTFEQPDKSMVDVIGTGDEYYQNIESPDGYTLVRNDENWICYAKLNNEGTELESTDVVYTGDTEKVPDGIEKHLEITQDSVNEKVKEARKELSNEEDTSALSKSSLLETRAIKDTDYTYNTKKDIVGLTIMVDFSDVKSSMSIDDVSNFLNSEGYSGYDNNGSVHDYFYDISNGMLNYTNKVIRVEVPGKKEDYDKVNSESGQCARRLIEEIQKLVTDKDLEGVSKKSDGSLYILNILYSGSCNSGWTKGLWAHKSYTSFKGMDQVYEISDLSNQLTIGTICHETGHALLGYPDLYSYYTSEGKYGSGPSIVGDYCLMGSGAHNESDRNPAPPNPYLRYFVSGFKGSVLDLNSIKDGTVLSLKSNDNGNAEVYEWSNLDRGEKLYEKECYLLENIQKSGRYKGVSKPGLVVWHIDNSGSNYNVNYSKHYISIIDAVNPSQNLKCTPFSSETNTMINRVVTPNAKWNEGKYSELKISNISDSKKEMTFQKGCTVKPGFYSVGGNGFYVTNESGETAKGFKEIDSKTYYFDNVSGDAYKGIKRINNKSYYFDETTGVMQKGLVSIGKNKYYFDMETGEMKDGWIPIGDKKYYFGSDGLMKTGLVNIGGKNYYFNKDGALDTNKKGLIFEGNYKVLNPTDYNLDCKNQITLGDKIKFQAGFLDDSRGFTYSYTVSYKGVQAPAKEYGPFKSYNIGEFNFTPDKGGLVSINIKVTDADGKEYMENVIVEVNSKLEMDSIMVDGDKISSEDCYTGNAGETVKLKTLTKGGYRYDDMKYTYKFKSAMYPDRPEKVYTDVPSDGLQFTFEEADLFEVTVIVEDKLGNVVEDMIFLDIY